MPLMLLVLGFSKIRVLTYAYGKGGWVSILKLLTVAYVRMKGWVRTFELLTDAYVRGRVGGYGRIPCLRNMWMTP